MSVGGGNINEIEASVDILKSLDDFAVLHCVSEYPCPPDKLNLNQILELKKILPEGVIGVSDHFSGISSGPVSYMLGARVFEKHVTFSHTMKGTDHAFSLLPEGFRKFVRDIKNVPLMVGGELNDQLGKEHVFQKLGKSLIAKKNIARGDVITSDMLGFIIADGDNIPVRESYNIIGQKALVNILAKELIKPGMIEKK